MTPAVKGALAAGLVVLTGPFGLLALGVYFLRKQADEQKRQTQILSNVVITPTEDK
jgi:hypothetical protein